MRSHHFFDFMKSIPDHPGVKAEGRTWPRRSILFIVSIETASFSATCHREKSITPLAGALLGQILSFQFVLFQNAPRLKKTGCTNGAIWTKKPACCTAAYGGSLSPLHFGASVWRRLRGTGWCSYGQSRRVQHFCSEIKARSGVYSTHLFRNEHRSQLTNYQKKHRDSSLSFS